MCGIVGAVAERNIAYLLVDGLKRLEYRGYDSAGLALVNLETPQIERLRVKGKVANLAKALETKPIPGHIGIAHTRWATHGEPTVANAHPHFSDEELAIVHNGIIENHDELRQKLITAGYTFSSDTDTEVIVHLIHLHLKNCDDVLKAIQKTVAELEGAYGLGVISQSTPDKLYAVRSGSPLVIGLGDKENYIASDPLALLPLTNQFIYLEEGDMAVVAAEEIQLFNADGSEINHDVHISELNPESTSKGDFAHYMIKEIYDQPQMAIDALDGRYLQHKLITQAFGVAAPELLKKTERVHIIACGTSYHAGLIAKYWIEEYAGLPCHVEVASENRYRTSVIEPNTLLVSLSQSGETADTLAALRKGMENGYMASLAICNVSASSLVREADMAFMVRAGTEIGVAATKSFTAQLMSLLMFTGALAASHGKPSIEKEIAENLEQLPSLLDEVLKLDAPIKIISEKFRHQKDALFLGRGVEYPISLEGALKLKEISYIHAEAYPAGELKHGPLALVDDDMPIIVLSPNDHLATKLSSNIQEVQARGGLLTIFTDKRVNWEANNRTTVVTMPDVPIMLAPMIYNIPLQLLAYHIAVVKGTDVDQPRNLAKSVTVE